MRSTLVLCIKAAVVGVLLNVLLSFTAPLLPNATVSAEEKEGAERFYLEVLNMFVNHKANIYSSSLIVAVAVFVSVGVAKLL